MTDRMLKTFLYLDEKALLDYVSGLEGGLRGPVSKRSMVRSTTDGSLDARVAKANKAKGSEDEESVTITDTPQAMFNRFLTLVNDDPEAVGWLEIMDPDTELESVNVGMMINVEADVYVPDAIGALSQAGELSTMIDTMESMLPFAKALGLDTANLPPKPQRDAMKGFSAFQNLIGGKTVVVGDIADSESRIAGQLSAEFVRADLDGLVTVVGKVSATWPKGKWKPFLALPGTSLIPREQRRNMERQRPEPGQEGNFLEGPAVMLDVLAIYR